jgi:aryl-alcohol dehydrogenase-like predicted oxidoreductase
VCEQPPYSILVRGIEAEVLPTCAAYGMGVIPWSPLAGGYLSGRLRKGASEQSHRAERMPQRYDVTRPENQAKLEAVEKLAAVAEQAGMSLIHLALGFVLSHPTITSAIVGPRTLEQLEGQLGGADVKLSADVLDAIDEIVPPGTNVNPLDAGWTPPQLADASSRRR